MDLFFWANRNLVVMNEELNQMGSRGRVNFSKIYCMFIKIKEKI
jgi:hypothetical protein